MKKKSKGGFFSKKRGKGTVATTVSSEWLNAMQETLLFNVNNKMINYKKVVSKLKSVVKILNKITAMGWNCDDWSVEIEEQIDNILEENPINVKKKKARKK